jgi:hypothetical protein
MDEDEKMFDQALAAVAARREARLAAAREWRLAIAGFA